MALYRICSFAKTRVQWNDMKYFLIALLTLVIIGSVAYVFQQQSDTTVIATPTPAATSTPSVPPPPPTPPVNTGIGPVTVIGNSVNGTPIPAYHFGVGENEVVLIGGIHGGYSWGTSLLGQELVSYFQKNPQIVPADVTVTIIPTLNPDGLAKVLTSTSTFIATDVTPLPDQSVARFNANNVDLNRNFDCKWQPQSTWQNKTVSGGKAPFSEPEAKAISTYLTNTTKPALVITWFSAAGGVYGSACEGEMGSSTREYLATFASASGYTEHDTFDSYTVNGDMTNWLATLDIPAISVLLTSHGDSEFDKNIAGITAILKTFNN
jgi:hypothetical protein